MLECRKTPRGKAPAMSENRRDYFFWNRSAFEKGVRRRVCSLCEYCVDGVCHTPDPRGCALFRYLPEMVMVAQHLSRPSVSEYVPQLDDTIKMECLNPDPGARCRLNDTLKCGLEKLLPSLLRAVRETDRMLEKRPGFGNYDY
jgi:hypothetical protein